MEGRLPPALHLEMWSSSWGVDAVIASRQEVWTENRMAVFENCCRDRDDLPRDLPEFDVLIVVECGADDAAPKTADGCVGSYRFVRTKRPGQGSLTGERTSGVQLVLISPEEPDQAQELRDWADFTHIRHIAETVVPGFRMITPYVNAAAGNDGAVRPRFLHLYEMDADDPEAAFQDMTPRVAARLGGRETDEYEAWAWHPQLRIDYVNTFRRVG